MAHARPKSKCKVVSQSVGRPPAWSISVAPTKHTNTRLYSKAFFLRFNGHAKHAPGTTKIYFIILKSKCMFSAA